MHASDTIDGTRDVPHDRGSTIGDGQDGGQCPVGNECRLEQVHARARALGIKVVQGLGDEPIKAHHGVGAIHHGRDDIVTKANEGISMGKVDGIRHDKPPKVSSLA